MRRFLLESIGWMLIIALGPLLAVSAGGQALPIWAPPPLGRLITEGLHRNNEIGSIKDQIASLKARISYAGSLDDPRLGLAILNLPTDSFRFDQEPMTQKQIFIAQKFPWFGKLDLRSRRATFKAVRQQAVLQAKRLELSGRIAKAYYELGFVGTGLAINAKLTNTVSQLLGVAESRYATGRGLQQDVLQAQVELSKLLDEKIRLKKKRRTLEDEINALLNRERFSPVAPPVGLHYPDIGLQLRQLQDRAVKENPLVRVRLAEIDTASTEIQLAHKDYWPDMDVRLAYGQRDEDFNGRSLPDFVTASVTVNLPVWQKQRQDPNLVAAQKAHQAAVKRYLNLIESLPYQVESLVTEIRDTQENYRLFSDALLLQAEQWASSALTAYEVGKVEFNTMIAAQIRLLRFELRAANYIYKTYQKRAELEEIIGGPLQKTPIAKSAPGKKDQQPMTHQRGYTQ